MRKHFKLIGMSLVLCGLVSFSSCSKDDDDDPDPGTGGGTPVNVTGVTLNKRTTSIAVGATETLQATIAPSNASNKSVTWTSTNTGIATVTNGVVKGIAAGSTYIKVTTANGNFKDSCQVTVTQGGGPTTGTLKVQIEGYPQWTANYIDAATNGQLLLVEASAGNDENGLPYILFMAGTEVTGADEWYGQDNTSFLYAQQGFVNVGDGELGDWCIGTYTSGGKSAGVTISSINLTNLTVSGTITGVLVSTQDYIVNGSTTPAQKTIEGTFTNISLTSVAKKSTLNKSMSINKKGKGTGNYLKNK